MSCYLYPIGANEPDRTANQTGKERPCAVQNPDITRRACGSTRPLYALSARYPLNSLEPSDALWLRGSGSRNYRPLLGLNESDGVIHVTLDPAGREWHKVISRQRGSCARTQAPLTNT